ncbi:hypothetical protein CVT25_000710, partial [Psilocybe cyanescens]
MSVDDNFDYSPKIQQSVIGASLNLSMFLNFIMGIYTMMYIGTMYLYFSRKPANTHRCGILYSISMLYLLCMIVFVIQWYYLDFAIVINGDTKESIFNATIEGGPVWIFVFFQFFFYSVFIVSDELLIWQCYYVWDMSWRVISVPLALFFAEFCLLIAVSVTTALFSIIASAADATIADDIASAQVFMLFGTTVTTSSLIAYKIHTALQLTASHSKRSFSHVVVNVLEPAAVYALVVFIYAVLSPCYD